MLVIYEKVLRHFWRIAIVTRVLPTRDSEIRGPTVKIAKANTILKRLINKLFAKIYIMILTKQIRQVIKRYPPLFLLSCES